MARRFTAGETFDKQVSSRAHTLRKVFSFPVALAGLLSLLAVLTVRGRFDDPDTWWHLRMGQVIWTTRAIPRTDIFSYTTNHHAYVAHEWISQICIFLAYKLGDYPGLMLWLCFFSSAVLVAGFAFCWIYSGNAKVAFVGAITIWLFSTIGLAIRPQLIGYLFLIFELFILYLGSSRNSRWFYCLPPLFAVWVNSHGSFSFGLTVAGLVLFSSFFHFQAGLLVAPQWDVRYRRTLVLSLLLSIAVLFLNPVGVNLLLYPIDTLLHQPVGMAQVHEWQPLEFSDVRAYAMLAVLAACLLRVIVRQTQLFLHELLIIALATWMAVSHRRMLFVFGIVVAPVLSRLLANAWEGYDSERDRPLPNAVLILCTAWIIISAFPHRQDLVNQVEAASPVKAVAFIKNSRLSGPMLNEYVYGGYLIWAAPEYPVFVDGRGDVYDATGVFEDMSRWANLQADPNELLNKYGIKFCLLANQSPMVKVMVLLHWKEIYSDNNAVIFVPDINHT